MGLLALSLIAALSYALRPALVRRWFVAALTAADRGDAQTFAPRLAGADTKRPQIAVTLERVGQGFEQPTDIQFPPAQADCAVVLEKTGKAHWLDLTNGKHGEFLRAKVLTASEEGLLGLAFHPDFARNGRFFVDYVTEKDGQDTTRIEEWKASNSADLRDSKASAVRVLLEVRQPYANHNAGQLVFGPDGMLYVGLGDGGSHDDPRGNGQNARTLLGSMLRIDVNTGDASAGGDKPYRVPEDNPFVGKAGYLPEIWAYGLRNPWRYSFDPQRRLIVADVGQDKYEEIDIVQAGDNLGWNLKEGFECPRGPESACQRPGLVAPVFAYGRDHGRSITGGFVYTGKRIDALRGLYVFADFVSGEMSAIELPRDRSQRVTHAVFLGQWPISPSTFGRDADGELYVASYTRGEVYRLAADAAAQADPESK